jgi:hypothetical protein
MKRKLWAALLLLVALSLLTAGVLAAPPIWQRMCGNWPIEIYGRIVDVKGRAIADATVVYRVTYCRSPAIPVMAGGSNDRVTKVSVRTDSRGEYTLHGIYGRYAGLVEVQAIGVSLESAMGIPCSQETGWLLANRSQRVAMPNVPERRITYTFNRATTPMIRKPKGETQN